MLVRSLKHVAARATSGTVTRVPSLSRRLATVLALAGCVEQAYVLSPPRVHCESWFFGKSQEELEIERLKREGELARAEVEALKIKLSNAQRNALLRKSDFEDIRKAFGSEPYHTPGKTTSL